MIKISKSITFHNGTSYSREHNRRNEKYTDSQEHIDKNRKNENITFVDMDIKKAYEEIFGESFKEYNSKIRKDRRCNSYYEKIKNSGQKNLAYECIVQIGDIKDTGYSSEREQQVLRRFFEEWEQRNPNLKIFGAYLHNDEGTSHLHIDYIPVAKFDKGMKLQNSLNKALKQQGCNGINANHTEQMEWQNKEREALAKICSEMNIEVRTIKTKSREHMNTPEYKAMMSELEQKKEQMEKEILSYQPPPKKFGETQKSYSERVQIYQQVQYINNYKKAFKKAEESFQAEKKKLNKG